MSVKPFVLGIVLGSALATAAVALTAQAPAKKAYVLVQSEVTNAEQYAAYAKLSPATITKAGGTFLARGGRSTTLEGVKAPARVVVIEFPTFEAAEQWYHSPEYTAVRQVRAGAATMQFVVVEAQ